MKKTVLFAAMLLILTSPLTSAFAFSNSFYHVKVFATCDGDIEKVENDVNTFLSSLKSGRFVDAKPDIASNGKGGPCFSITITYLEND